MKRISLLLIIVFAASAVFSQQIVTNSTIKKFGIGMDINADFWPDMPDGIDSKGLSRGINLFGMYNHSFKNSMFSFAVGLGLGTHNLYLNGQVDMNSPDTTRFIKIADSVNYKKNKLMVSYLDLPFELRFKTKKEFRMAIGFKAGILLGKNTKYKGDNPTFPNTGEMIIKSNYLPNLQKYRYGPTFRIGYKWFNLFAFYQLSDLFKPDQGPEMAPLSVGITLMPF